MAVFEVLEPTSHRRSEAADDFVHALALRSTCSIADRVLELIHALLPRPFHGSFEVVAQEFESTFLPFIHDSRLCRMYCQPVFL